MEELKNEETVSQETVSTDIPHDKNVSVAGTSRETLTSFNL